ncbi:MAG: ORF6N domain-containing protein [Candidatus Eisenbacteria bacterium]
MPSKKAITPVGHIEKRILLVRGQKVIIDADIAQFYGVSTKRLNEQVKRNKQRFPEDFMFQLTLEEKSEVVANCDHLSGLKFSRTRPYAFTEHRAIMAASVLNTPCAVEVSVFIVRAFVRLRGTISQHRELAQHMARLERRTANHDQQILSLVKAIRQLTGPGLLPKKRRIGFHEE